MNSKNGMKNTNLGFTDSILTILIPGQSSSSKNANNSLKLF